MSPLSALRARTLLNEYGLRPRKALGQNFLVSAGARELIVEAAALEASDVVLEIGPGLGALTERLAQTVAQVISVELDEALYAILQDTVGDFENVTLVHADILDSDIGTLGLAPGYVVVANIPYNITSALIRKLMEAETPASRVVLTVQREVAERIIAVPGDMNLLALGVQVFGSPAILGYISAGSFYPPPSVESAIVRVDMHARQTLDLQLVDTVFKLARAGFAQKRKQLKNTLAHGLPLDKVGAEKLLISCGVDPTARAQTLDVERWFCLARSYLNITEP